MKNRNTVIYGGAWCAIAVFTLIDFWWASRAGFTIGRGWPLSFAELIVFAFGSAGALIALARLKRYHGLTAALRCREFASAILCLITVAVLGQAVSVMTYLGVALNVPSISVALSRIDQAIGFDWLEAYRWVATHRNLWILFKFAYFSIFPQMIVIPLILAAARRPDEISEFVAILVVSAILLLLISIPFPAESEFIKYGITDPGTLSTVSDYDRLREGAMRAIDPYKAQGLVSMPSFHTMVAIFFSYSVRHVKFVFPVAIVANAVMIASTITVGGHYLVDVFAGVVCGVAVIAVVRLGLRRLSSERGATGLPSAASDTGGSSAAVR